MVNSHYLKYIIHRNGDTVEELAKDLGITRVSLSSKINNKTEFKLSESIKIKKKYRMTERQFLDAFDEEEAR